LLANSQAIQAATAFSQQLPYHQLDDLQVLGIVQHQRRGRPHKDQVGHKHYQISATLISKPKAIEVEIQRNTVQLRLCSA
jgi:hypothetical protein